MGALLPVTITPAPGRGQVVALDPVERWAPHPRHTLYEVSNQGNVRRIGSKRGPLKHRLSRKNRLPYWRVDLHAKGNRTTEYVHRLVYEAHVGRIPKGCEINHKDGDSLRSVLSNLELCTPLQNTRHAVAIGRNTNMKLDDADVAALRAGAGLKMDLDALAKRFGITPRYARAIVAFRARKLPLSASSVEPFLRLQELAS